MFTAATQPRVPRAPAAPARDLAGRVSRFLWVMLGMVILAVGLVTAVLPGHIGLPVLLVGLAIVLRNSFKARRRFVAIQKAYPRFVFPLRRLLRREPEVVPVFWQQFLRMERMILPHRHRRLVRARRALVRRRRHAYKAAAAPVAVVAAE